MPFLRSAFVLLIILVSTLLAFADQHQVLPPLPLEASPSTTLPTSAQIETFLHALTVHSARARLIPLGHSAGSRPLQAICISADPDFCQHGHSQPGKLRVLLVGSQHGTEPSGAEALQRVARELLSGSLDSYQSTMDFIMLVNGNPDGRDLRRRVNANAVNLSTDYVLLSQPESQAVVTILHRFQPHVILDVHESALLKKRTLGAQGFMTDFEAQFETANNPNVEDTLHQWSRAHFLPALLSRVNAHGLPASHYIGEITDINQPITHGGLSLRTLRNYAGLLGSLSVLVENRLDPPGDYPTPRNIATRVNKQFVSITTFLAQCETDRANILERVQAAQTAPGHAAPRALSLVASYAPQPGQPTITLPMRRRDTGVLEQRAFEYHGQIVASQALSVPQTYFVLAHQADMAALLDRHAIPYTHVQHPAHVQGIRQHIQAIHPIHSGLGKGKLPQIVLGERVETIQLSPSHLRIDLNGTTARLVPLLLDPRSISSVFHTPPYANFLIPDTDLFVVRSTDQAAEPCCTPTGRLHTEESTASYRLPRNQK